MRDCPILVEGMSCSLLIYGLGQFFPRELGMNAY